MSTSLFTRLEAGGAFYFLDQDEGAIAPDDYCIAFLSRGNSDTPLTLEQTWTTYADGVYLFLKIAKQALPQSTFEPQLHQLLNETVFANTRFLWIENPTDARADWRLTALGIEPTSEPRVDVVSQPTHFNFRNFSLFVAGGSRVTLNDTNDGFVLTRTNSDPDGFSLTTGFGENYLRGVGDTIRLPLQGGAAGCLQLELTLRRPQPGATHYAELADLDSGLRLFFKDPEVLPTDTDFAVQSYRYPFLGEDQAALEYYERVQQDLNPQQDLTLYPTLDLLYPQDETRTYFGFVHPSNGSKTTAIPSGYRTNLGYTIHLTPRDQSSRLVFATMPFSNQLSDRDPFYLVPVGEFEMTVPPYSEAAKTPQKNLLCGLSGVEYIKLEPDQTSLLCFKSGQNAFAASFAAVAPITERLLEQVSAIAAIPSTELQLNAALDDLGIDHRGRLAILEMFLAAYFPPDYQLTFKQNEQLPWLKTLGELVTWFQQVFRDSKPRPETSEASLTPLATTAWAYVQQTGGSSFYYAQPEQAVLYRASSLAKTAGNSDLLQFMEVPTTALSAPSSGDLPVFPLLPYGGVQGAMVDFQQLEVELLNPKRRKIISLHADHDTPFPAAPSDAPAIGTTPQGLLATFFKQGSKDYETMSLLLAKDTDGDPVQFQAIERRSPLRAALQSNQLFLVISNPNTLKSYFATDNQLTIQGWTFDLDPDHWQQHGTILIFKFFDQPLLDLLQSPQAWSHPEAFVGNLDSTRTRLVNLFQDAINRVDQPSTPQKDRDNYGPLARIARAETWSGILALNVPVPPENLPEELLAIAAGIDEQKFYAQYLGIETTPIEPKNGTLEAKQSSLFGLIDYQNETVPLPSSTGYDFEVRNLRVLFQNSLVKAFSSEIAVTLDRLFDEETKLVDGPGDRNLVLLKGTAENHNGKTTYAFSFSGENHFVLPQSKVLNQVEIIKAQFSTDPIAKPITDSTLITGRFTFWGRLNFKQLGTPQKPFDALSFGADSSPDSPPSPTKPNNKFLSFSNLAVKLAFQKSKPEGRTFTFDPGNLLFDTKRSEVRKDSLYAKFPLKLTGLLYSQGSKKTDDFGYMPVKAPLSGKLDDPLWYGLTFDLQLGSLGALAGKAGLVATLLVAWSPGSEGKLFIGLKLPGSTGGKREITLQGILKLAFKSIELVVGKTDSGQVSYLLKLKNIVLKFMVLSIPPTAQTEIIIFGDPGGTAENNTVGWYAAYAKE